MAPTRRKRHTTTIQIPAASADPWAAQLGEFKESAYRDSSNWNSLLRWHRRNRGPQWDYSTAMYHVDVGSKEFFAGVEPAAPVTEPDLAPTAASERVGVKSETDKLDSPERPTTGARGAQNRPSSSSSVSANHVGQLGGPNQPTNFPPMPAPALSTSTNSSAPNIQMKSTQYQQPQQYAAPVAPSPSAEMRQQYEAMFHANRQRAASQQAQQQQQQQFAQQGGAGSSPHQRMPSGPAYSPPAGGPQQLQQPFFQPNQQAMYQQMQQMASQQQMFRPPQQSQQVQQQQQIDPRAVFQQPQQ